MNLRPRLGSGRSARQPWNLNIHFDALLASLASPGDRVLDVGCGDGFLSARLAASGCEVVALDTDAGVLARARQRWPHAQVAWTHGDIMTYPFEPAGFDAVLSNAVLHHLPDTAVALDRLASLVRPGGRLGVVGFARNGALDWPRSLVGAAATRAVNAVRGKWEHTAPQFWPPALTYGQVRRVSEQVLPGRTFRKMWLGRYVMTWTKPYGARSGPGEGW